MLTGACHCGDVTFEVEEKPGHITECNCSICHRYGVLWAYYTRKSATVFCNEGAQSSYSRGDRKIEFFHCKNCGCVTHYESVDKHDDARIAINARMLDRTEISDIPRRKFDGAVSWKLVDEWP